MATSLEVIIPVLNEENALARSVDSVRRFLSTNLGGYDWRVQITDNGSTDSSPDIARRLSSEHCRVTWSRLEERGRGRALSRAWIESEADIVCYMDVDLSTDLSALPELIEAIDGGECDIAIGSRLARGAEVAGRSILREFLSRGYNAIVWAMFRTSFRDAQCGFKAASRRAVRELVPLVQDTGWFFDSELLILAGKNGYRIKEIPVKWTDDPDSRVKVVRTAYGDMKGLLRLRFGGLKRASRLLTLSRGRDERKPG